MVAAGHPATADAGAAILRTGGNAVDAALAAVTTAFCAEPVLTAAGGGGFMLIAPPAREALLYDGFARMPTGLRPPAFTLELRPIPIDFGDTVQTFHIGQASVAAPSLLAMLFTAHRRHGRLPLHEALAPGIDAARNGIRLNALQASFIELLQPILGATPTCKALHAPAGEWLRAGDLFRNPDLANTLEMLAIDGIDEMYRGDLARTIVATCAPHGLLGMADMQQAGQVELRRPLRVDTFGGTLLTNPPPSAGGLLIAFAARLLELLQQQPDTAAWPVLLAEALRAAAMLRRRGLDARIHESGIAAEMLDQRLLHAELEQIRERLRGGRDPHPDETANRHGSTTHISIIDRDGMAVSLTSSNGEGSGLIAAGSGIHLNNMLGEEDINPLGFHALAGGMPLPSMMAPSLFMQDGEPRLVLGSGGSNRLRGAILQVLTRTLLLDEPIEAAVNAPRLHPEGNRLDIEPDCLSAAEQEQLMQLGWQINRWQQQSVYFGGVHTICRSGAAVAGCGDPRRGGAVAAV